jgi:hypothetical protein
VDVLEWGADEAKPSREVAERTDQDTTEDTKEEEKMNK